MSYLMLSIARNALLPILLAGTGHAGKSRGELSESVDLIELNHYYDDLGRHAYDQIIFYEWSSEYRRFHVIAWCLVEEDLMRLPTRDHARKAYSVRWQDRDSKKMRTVWSKHYRETWTQSDPERDNKKLMDEKYRISLLRVPANQPVINRIASRVNR